VNVHVLYHTSIMFTRVNFQLCTHTHTHSLSLLLFSRCNRYKSISTESNAFKSKVAPLLGATSLLKAVGFQKGASEEDEGKLKFIGDATSPLLKDTAQKLADAIAVYKQQNPV